MAETKRESNNASCFNKIKTKSSSERTNLNDSNKKAKSVYENDCEKFLS